MPGGSSDRWWWRRLWWGDNIILGCRRVPQVRRLNPAVTASDITRLRGCVGTAGSENSDRPHVPKDCFSRKRRTLVTSSCTFSTLVSMTSVRPSHCCLTATSSSLNSSVKSCHLLGHAYPEPLNTGKPVALPTYLLEEQVAGPLRLVTF
ncbi:hypothetical protein E2C01_038207 [Portunus trituberculatus]|uniref:Uncharacterized protein n=1 Tax=Portunus trituberculatus TaxID=210409 RepID=A0A5B7FJC2_PORTR|nr:hypothetical protein [Portunus trituberculatus]